MATTKEEKQAVIRKHRRHDKDCGSSEVQIAVLTEKIRYLTEHLTAHKKDHATRRGLLMLVGQRNTLLRYLQREDFQKYQALIDELGLRK